MELAITTKGQATIPKAIREHLGLKAGDRLKFFIHPDGSVVLLPKRSALCLARRCQVPREGRFSGLFFTTDRATELWQLGRGVPTMGEGKSWFQRTILRPP